MNKNKLKIIIGIVLMVFGFYGATLNIPITWHYFGTGVAFGVGLCLLALTLYQIRKSKKST